MSIYSVNRTGSMALAQVAANESYTSGDFGRILYETQVNDMAFFEAILACDFNEIKGLREGTLLESEVTALNEASVKEFVAKRIEDLKRFWAKIKAALGDACDKIAAWILKHGKGLTKRVRETNFSNWGGSVPDVHTYTFDKNSYRLGEIKNTLRNAVKSKDTDTSNIVGEYLGNIVHAGHPISVGEYHKYCLDLAKRDPITLNKSNVKNFADEIDKDSDHIKYLKDYTKEVESSVKGMISDLKTAAKEADNVAKLNTIVKAYQTIISVLSKTAIAITRADMKSRAKAVSLALANCNRTVKENAEIEARCITDEFDFMMTEALNMDTETRTAVAELVEAC